FSPHSPSCFPPSLHLPPLLPLAPISSASFEMGNTKVLAVVYGPREVTNRADALPDRAVVRCEYVPCGNLDMVC
ncbi:unnamed protein product, partial [Closterium sp. NIES-53]